MVPFQFFRYFATNWFFKKPKGCPFYDFRYCEIFQNIGFLTCDISEKKIFCFQLGEKWFPSLIGHDTQSLGVSKLFSELFVKTSWHNLKILRILSLRYNADFRRSRLFWIFRSQNSKNFDFLRGHFGVVLGSFW